MDRPRDNKWTRRQFLKGSSIALTAGLGLSVTEALAKERTSMESDRPNIIFFFSDQQRWDSVNCYGKPLHENVTPNLDKMAVEGVRFEHAFTCQPVCGPARAVIQTGKYATETGCHVNGIALKPDETTIAHRLSAAGYEVAYIGKWHLAGRDHKNGPIPMEKRGGYKDYWLAADVLEFTSHGYDGFMYDADNKKVEFKGYRVDCVTDFALDYLRKRKSKKPFFLTISYIEPHHQNDHKHFEGPEGSKERFKNFRVPGDLEGTEGDWKEEMPDYLGCCNSLDYNLGRLRTELEKLGLAENTVILYTSDHACHFRTRNAEYKRSCHENTIRIPMVACGPGFKGGKVVKEMVSLIDVAPTILAAGKVNVPGFMRGRPLQELADGTAKDWRKDIYIEISESQTGRAIRTDKWKYSVAALKEDGTIGPVGPRSDVYVEHYLYNLEKDPDERNNLVKDPAYTSVRKELAELLKKRIAEVEGKAPEINAAV